jgi:hypothetical protein
LIPLAVRWRPTVKAAVAAALLICVPTLAACGDDRHPAASESVSATTTTAVQAAPPPDTPLPPPAALTDVLYRLADTALPADQKVPLVEGATTDDAARIDNFGKALADSGYTPLGFTAENIAWASSPPGNVTADVSVHSEAQTTGFTFPMEFKPVPTGGWQLSKTTAGILLTFNPNPATPTG